MCEDNVMYCDRCRGKTYTYQRITDPEDDVVYTLCQSCWKDYSTTKLPVRWFCNELPKMNNPDSLFPNQLSIVFEVPGKTLKLKVKQGTLVEDAFKHALVYLNSQDMYTRIEFKHGTNYIVVAKLKEG